MGYKEKLIRGYNPETKNYDCDYVPGEKTYFKFEKDFIRSLQDNRIQRVPDSVINTFKINYAAEEGSQLVAVKLEGYSD